MNLFIASIVLGIVPMVVYAFIVWRIDRWEKEPGGLLAAAFLWGALPSIIFAIIAQSILNLPIAELPEDGSIYVALYQVSIVAPVTEEIIKGLGLALVFLLNRREIDSVLDGLVYGSVIGFGFAAVENVFFFLGQKDPQGLMVLFFLRAFIFGMLHALFTGLLGVGLALGKFSRRPFMRVLWPLLGLALAIFTHAMHNTLVTIGPEYFVFALLGVSIGILWFVVMVVVSLWHENRWIRIHLSGEVDSGVLYAEQAVDAARFWSRSHLGVFSPAFWKRKKLLHEATELAFEKQRQSRFGATPACEARIARLREDVRRLSRQDPLVLSGVIRPGTPLPPPLPPVRRRSAVS